MVDVGYNIDGRHGVIRNVVPLSNTATEHLCFTEVRGDEQYALKKENIDYVIPHEDKVTCEDIAKGLEKQAQYCNAVKENEMTFAEKFKEAFGLEPTRSISLCDIVNCEGIQCSECSLRSDTRFSWSSPYKKIEVTEG